MNSAILRYSMTASQSPIPDLENWEKPYNQHFRTDLEFEVAFDLDSLAIPFLTFETCMFDFDVFMGLTRFHFHGVTGTVIEGRVYYAMDSRAHDCRVTDNAKRESGWRMQVSEPRLQPQPEPKRQTLNDRVQEAIFSAMADDGDMDVPKATAAVLAIFGQK